MKCKAISTDDHGVGVVSTDDQGVGVVSTDDQGVGVVSICDYKENRLNGKQCYLHS